MNNNIYAVVDRNNNQIAYEVVEVFANMISLIVDGRKTDFKIKNVKKFCAKNRVSRTFPMVNFTGGTKIFAKVTKGFFGGTHEVVEFFGNYIALNVDGRKTDFEISEIDMFCNDETNKVPFSLSYKKPLLEQPK